MNIKRVMSLSLAACLSLSPMVAMAEDAVKSNTDIVSENEKQETPNYIEFKGKITNINSNDKTFSILVENDKDKLIAHIVDDVILLDDSTLDFIDKEDLEEGMEISMFYSKDTIMLMSYPGQLKPDSIVVRSSKDFTGIKVDKFDKDLVSEDNMLKLNINEGVEVVDREGNKLSKEDILNKDLLVFFTASTKSIPAQTTPEKIIVIKNNEPTVFNKVIINDEEIKLEDHMYKNKDGIVMMPLREIAEKLGYKLVWNKDDSSIELTKGAQWTKVIVGEDNYNFAKMMVELGAAPELKETKTYVPINFLEKVLMANMENTVDGTLKITQ
ncbi:MAG: stalk domain-containing protein [Tissierellaceae bacterium]